MAKGRKALPNEVKVLRGTDQPCRMQSEQIAMSKISSIPKCKLKGTAKKIFESVASELIHKQLFEFVGLDLIIAYSREMGLYHDLSKELEKDGYTIKVKSKNGTTIAVSPKRKIAETALSNAKVIAVEFGFTPASRSRVAALVNPEVKKDDFSEFEDARYE